MKNLFKLKAMLRIAVVVAFVAAIGFAMVACEGEKCPGGCGHSRPPIGDTCEVCDYTEDGCKGDKCE